MFLTDSHCHIHMAKPSIDEVLEQADEHDVKQMLCVALNDNDAKTVLDIVQKYEHVFMAAAWHPNDAINFVPEVDAIVELCSQHEKILAVGETGLDYFRSEQSYDELKWQRKRFEHHIEAAKQIDKPVIIHTREAMDDTIAMLVSEGAEQCGGVLHCFTGTKEDARKLLDIDFYISFSGIITFNSAKDIKDVINYVPKERLLIETDTPYLAPTPYRGKENRPAYVRYVAQTMADELGVDIDTIANITTENFNRLFQKKV